MSISSFFWSFCILTVRLTTDEHTQTATIFDTTVEEMNKTTPITSQAISTTITIPQTSMTITMLLLWSITIIFIISGSTTVRTSTISDLVISSSTIESDLVLKLGVPLGLGLPALLITIGGLFYQYRKGKFRSNATSDRTNPNEIPMTVRNA